MLLCVRFQDPFISVIHKCFVCTGAHENMNFLLVAKFLRIILLRHTFDCWYSEYCIFVHMVYMSKQNVNHKTF